MTTKKVYALRKSTGEVVEWLPTRSKAREVQVFWERRLGQKLHITAENENPARSARKMKSNPSKRKTRKRVSSALKKWVKAETAKVRKNAGRKVKGGRAVSLKNFTGRVIRKSNGQVQIIGRGKKA